MFSWFKRCPPPIDLEQAIYNVAEYQRDDDFQVLYQSLRDRHVYLPANAASLPKGLPGGSRYTTGPNDQIKIKSMTGPDLRPCIITVTQESHHLLLQGYIGMDWIDALEMTLGLGENVGVLVQGAKSWVLFDNQRVRFILNLYR